MELCISSYIDTQLNIVILQWINCYLFKTVDGNGIYSFLKSIQKNDVKQCPQRYHHKSIHKKNYRFDYSCTYTEFLIYFYTINFIHSFSVK